MKILCLNNYGIGNTICKTPMLHALHEAGHEVYLLWNAGSLGGPIDCLLESAPYIKDQFSFNIEEKDNADDVLVWIESILPDIAVQMFPGDTTFNFLFPFLKCDVRIAPKVDIPTKHEVDYNLDLVKDLIGTDCDFLYKLPEYSYEEESVKKINFLLRKIKRPYVVLCPSFKKDGAWVKKNWGIKNFAQLSCMLDKEGYDVVLVDGADGIQICNLIDQFGMVKANLAGCTNIQETHKVISGSACFIGNDCGPAHLAAHTGVATMALFGPTPVVRCQPLGKNVFVLKTGLECKRHDKTSEWDGCRCLTLLQPHLVMKIFGDYVDKKQKTICGSNDIQ